VTVLSVPAVVKSTTVPPLALILLPKSSFNWTVIVDVLVPFAVIDTGDAVIVDVTGLASPGINETEA
jgi:hypothetical protein